MASPTTQAPPFDFLFKIVLVGDSGVGKSNLLCRFTRNTFSDDMKATVGVEFATRIISMPDSKRIKAQIWDTAGQERFRAITTAYYRGALGAVLVYDCTSKSSFDNIPRWLNELRENASKDINLILVGNKCDLCPSETTQPSDSTVSTSTSSQSHQREVTLSQAQAMANSYGIPCIECSAKSGLNVEEAFATIVTKIYQTSFQNRTVPLNNKNPTATPNAVSLTSPSENKIKCCKN